MIALDLFLSFFKIGMVAFGGGYGALSLIQNEVIDVRRWLPLSDFLQLISVAEMTPGPIAINTATFVGYRMNGLAGSIAATIGVTLPSIFWIFLLLKFLDWLSRWIRTDHLFTALKTAIVALILAATLRIGIGSIDDLFTIFLACGAFYWLYRFKPSVVWVILATGGIGVLWSWITGLP